MKRRFFLILTIVAVALSCTKEKSECQLNISFSNEYSYPSIIKLKSSAMMSMTEFEIPDTNNFILTIIKGENETIYNGIYKDKPEKITLSAGTYKIGVYSTTFSTPAFDQPLFGDEQIIVVQGGENLGVSFICKQLNCGMRVTFGSGFISKYSNSELTLSSSNGSLQYPTSENRIAYFSPGRVEMHLKDSGIDKTLFARELSAANILQIKLEATNTDSPTNGGVSVVIDTTRVWLNEDILLGSENNGSSAEKGLRKVEIEGWIGAKNVWIQGYIVGGDLSSSGIKLNPPFTSSSNLAIADSPDEQNRNMCISVSLTSGTEARDALNLVNNPSNHKKKIYIKGEIVESYYGLIGVKNIKEFKIE